jgi:hypothetical protein
MGTEGVHSIVFFYSTFDSVKTVYSSNYPLLLPHPHDRSNSHLKLHQSMVIIGNGDTKTPKEREKTIPGQLSITTR